MLHGNIHQINQNVYIPNQTTTNHNIHPQLQTIISIICTSHGNIHQTNQNVYIPKCNISIPTHHHRCHLQASFRAVAQNQQSARPDLVQRNSSSNHLFHPLVSSTEQSPPLVGPSCMHSAM